MIIKSMTNLKGDYRSGHNERIVQQQRPTKPVQESSGRSAIQPQPAQINATSSRDLNTD